MSNITIELSILLTNRYCKFFAEEVWKNHTNFPFLSSMNTMKKKNIALILILISNHIPSTCVSIVIFFFQIAFVYIHYCIFVYCVFGNRYAIVVYTYKYKNQSLYSSKKGILYLYTCILLSRIIMQCQSRLDNNEFIR